MTRQKFNVLRYNKLLFIVLSSTVFSAYGLDSAQIIQVKIVAQVAMDVEQDQSTIPGVVTAIADDTSVIWQGVSNCDTQYETSGMACPASNVTTSDQYRVGSESKTYAGTVILRMIDEGHLSLSDTLQSLLPALNIPNASSITIQDLLQMTSGIPDYLNAPALFGDSGTINDQYVRANGALEITPPSVYIMATNSQARTSGMSYSNTNFAILGLIAEAKSCDIFTGCQTLEQLLTHYVMTPVSMTETLLPDDDQFTQAHATGYVMVEAGQPITGTASLESDDANELSDAFTFLNPKLPWAAGAIVSTPGDQILWNRQLTKNNLGLLSASLQNQRLTNTVPGSVAGIPANYGLAIYNMRSDYNGSTFIGHSGAIFGFTSSLFYNTDSDLFYVVNANQFPAWQSARDFLWQVDKGVHFVEDQQEIAKGTLHRCLRHVRD
ncbi:serine hydrolase [Vibrio sp. PP-XX7]